MAVPDKALISLPAQLGINNLAQENNLKPGELREAVNVDIPREEDALPKRRAGYTKIVSGTRVHSLFRKRQFPFALFVDGTTLYGLPLGQPKFVVASDLASREVSYDLIGDRVYWSNSQQSGIVYTDGTVTPWGVESPVGQPALAPSVNGGLAPGSYQIAVTFRDMRGEESGTGQAAVIALAGVNGGIALSNIPQPKAGNVVFVRIYVSGADGDVLYFARDVPVGMTSVDIGVLNRGIPLATQFLEPMPAGSIVRYFNGRAFVVTGAYMRWSEALRYGLTHLVNNYLRIGVGITLFQPVGEGEDGAGIFVADGKRTYFLRGNDPANFTRPIVYDAGAIPGTGCLVPGAMFGFETTVPVAYWLASNGVALVGLPGGTIQQLRQDATVAPYADKGASLFREQDGIRQVVTSLSGATRRGVAVSDVPVATVYRNGVVVQ